MKVKLKNTLKFVFLIFSTMILFGCGHDRVIYFYSLDKSQCITIINEYDTRYIINGKHDNVPEDNYVKLHIKDMYSIGDNFYVCWKNEKYEWDVLVDNSLILESKLDTTRFNFNTELPKDDRGIPTPIKFSKEKCATYLFYLRELSPDRGAIVEYK